MKWHETWLGAGVASLLLVAACSGSGDGGVALDPPVFEGDVATVEPAPTETPVPVEQATVEPTVVPVADEDRIAAAVAALDADGVRDLIAWDVLESSVDADGVVTLSLCGWTGADPFDAVYDSRWSTAPDVDGSVNVAHLGTSVDAGECLNTELIESAIDFIDEYEVFWTEMARYPDRYANDPRGPRLLTENRHRDALVFTRRHVEDGLHFRGLSGDGAPASDAVRPIVFRVATVDSAGDVADNGVTVIEFAICREMKTDYGLYTSGGAIFDNFRTDGSGPHSLTAYALVRSDDSTHWLYHSRAGGARVNCFFEEFSWTDGLTAWRGGEPAFQESP